MAFEKLHNHPHLEEKLGLDAEHVIIDKHTFLRLLNHEPSLVYYTDDGVERIEIVDFEMGWDSVMIRHNSFMSSIFLKKDIRPL